MAASVPITAHPEPWLSFQRDPVPAPREHVGIWATLEIPGFLTARFESGDDSFLSQ